MHHVGAGAWLLSAGPAYLVLHVVTHVLRLSDSFAC